MPELAFDAPNLTIFARLDELRLVVVGQHPGPTRSMLERRVVARPDEVLCRRGTVSRHLAHEPFGLQPTTQLSRVESNSRSTSSNSPSNVSWSPTVARTPCPHVSNAEVCREAPHHHTNDRGYSSDSPQ